MSDKPYFVMLNTQNGGATVMTDQEGKIPFYATESEARTAAIGTVFGEMLGYEIFERGLGSN